MQMKFGVAILPTEDVQDPAELGRMVEERGFESLFFSEHTHIPVSRESPYPGGGELPAAYVRTYDPFVALTAAATVTERLRVGTGICLLAQRDPIVTAKEVSTLDRISHGRFLFGVGAGWNLEEARSHGIDPARRFGAMRERIEAMKAIWTEDEASYHGRHVDFAPLWSRPKPVQRPHPPILIGGAGPRILDRVLAYGDEWFAPGAGEGFEDRVAELHARAAELGRDVAVTVSGVPEDPARIAELERAGVHRGLFWVAAQEPGAVEAALDRLAGIVSRR